MKLPQEVEKKKQEPTVNRPRTDVSAFFSGLPPSLDVSMMRRRASGEDAHAIRCRIRRSVARGRLASARFAGCDALMQPHDVLIDRVAVDEAVQSQLHMLHRTAQP